MERSPILTGGQVALMRADVATGLVLDENLNRVTNDNQRVFTVFNAYAEALAVAYEIFSNGRAECVIYGTDMEVLKYLTA